jgi:hypothetical protein
MKQALHKEAALRSPSAAMVVAGLLGIYFICGAAYSFALGRWFPGFPPQLDVFAVIFGGNSAGAYAEAAVATLLGIFCLVGVVLGWRRMRSNTSLERTRER